MYRRFLQTISAACLLFAFWPLYRFHNVTIFDWLAPIVILFALPYSPAVRGDSLGSFKLALYGIAIMSLAGIISVGASYDSYEHITKVAYLVIAFIAVVGLGYVLVNRQILTLLQVLTILWLSATVCSIACILQGKFGLNPMTGGISHSEPWDRMGGLAEHPIETGLIADFGVVIGLGLAMHTQRRWALYLVAIVINIYSFVDSASMTAVIALPAASAALCLYSRAYRVIFIGTVAVVLGLVMAFSFSADAQRLTSRLQNLSQSGGNYETVRTREMQWNKSIEMIEPSTLLVGNGYSELDLPYHLEIHNGIIASVFHFGLLGLLSQMLLIAFFASRLWHEGPRILRGVLLGCSIIFAVAYLTGPTLSRRSLWVPPVLLGAYLTTRRDVAASRARETVGATDLGSGERVAAKSIP